MHPFVLFVSYAEKVIESKQPTVFLKNENETKRKHNNNKHMIEQLDWLWNLIWTVIFHFSFSMLFIGRL